MPKDKHSMLNIKDIGPRLKAERENTPKLTQTEAAALVDVSMRSWQEYEAGRTAVPLDVLYRFAQLRNVSFSELIGIEEVPIERDGDADVPIVDRIPAGPMMQGFGEEGILGYMRVGVKDPDAFALVVHGVSMYPEIHEGDVVICSPRASFQNGKVYAVVIGEGEQSLKRVRHDTRSKSYALIPSNKEFPTLYVPEVQVLKLIRVVEIRRDLQ